MSHYLGAGWPLLRVVRQKSHDNINTLGRHIWQEGLDASSLVLREYEVEFFIWVPCFVIKWILRDRVTFYTCQGSFWMACQGPCGFGAPGQDRKSVV